MTCHFPQKGSFTSFAYLHQSTHLDTFDITQTPCIQISPKLLGTLSQACHILYKYSSPLLLHSLPYMWAMKRSPATLLLLPFVHSRVDFEELIKRHTAYLNKTRASSQRPDDRFGFNKMILPLTEQAFHQEQGRHILRGFSM